MFVFGNERGLVLVPLFPEVLPATYHQTDSFHGGNTSGERGKWI
jgi:hypothetical protein